MLSSVVDRGWKFIRGHKQGAGVVHSRPALRNTAPRPGPVAAVGISQVRKFFTETENLLVRQINEHRAVDEKLGADLRMVRDALSILEAQRQSTTAVIAELDAVPAWRMEKIARESNHGSL